MKVKIINKTVKEAFLGFGSNPKGEEGSPQRQKLSNELMSLDRKISQKFKDVIYKGDAKRDTPLFDFFRKDIAAYGWVGGKQGDLNSLIQYANTRIEDVKEANGNKTIDTASANLYIAGIKKIFLYIKENILDPLSEARLKEAFGMKQKRIDTFLLGLDGLEDNGVKADDSGDSEGAENPQAPTAPTAPTGPSVEDAVKSIDPKKMEQRFQVFKQNTAAVVNNVAEIITGIFSRVKPTPAPNAQQPAAPKPAAPAQTTPAPAPAAPTPTAPAAAPATGAAKQLNEITATTPENAIKILDLQIKKQLNDVLAKITLKDFQEAYVAVAKTKFKDPAQLQKAFKSMRMLEEQVQGIQSTEYQLMDILFKMKGPKGQQRGQEGLMFTVLNIMNSPAVNLSKVYSPADLEKIRSAVKSTFSRVMNIGNAGDPNQKFITNPKTAPKSDAANAAKAVSRADGRVGGDAAAPAAKPAATTQPSPTPAPASSGSDNLGDVIPDKGGEEKQAVLNEPLKFEKAQLVNQMISSIQSTLKNKNKNKQAAQAQQAVNIAIPYIKDYIKKYGIDAQILGEGKPKFATAEKLEGFQEFVANLIKSFDEKKLTLSQNEKESLATQIANAMKRFIIDKVKEKEDKIGSANLQESKKILNKMLLLSGIIKR